MKEHKLFPWWAGYLLISPLRKFEIDPRELTGEYVRPGMKILDAGCAMGYFSIPMAEMTGPEGRVYCVDLQGKMLKVLKKRADKRNLAGIIKARECSLSSLMIPDLAGTIDLGFVFAVLHEVGDKTRFIGEINDALKPGAGLIFGEPHVITDEEFCDEILLFENHGFSVSDKLLFKRKDKIVYMRKA